MTLTQIMNSLKRGSVGIESGSLKPSQKQENLKNKQIKSNNDRPACQNCQTASMPVDPIAVSWLRFRVLALVIVPGRTFRARRADLMSSHLSHRISAQLEPFLLITGHLKIDSGSKAISSSIPAVPKSQRACVTWQALSKVLLEQHSHLEATIKQISPACNVCSFDKPLSLQWLWTCIVPTEGELIC